MQYILSKYKYNSRITHISSTVQHYNLIRNKSYNSIQNDKNNKMI